MKKFLAMMMAMMMVFGAAACGGGEEAPVEELEVSMIELSNEYISMMIPEDYSDVQDLEGMVGAGGPGASIIIADPAVADLEVSDITEDAILMMAGDAYPDAELVEFENPVNIDGTDAVYATIKGTNADNGMELTVTYILVFYMLDDVLHEQDICFTYQAGEGTALEANLDEVVNSITVG